MFCISLANLRKWVKIPYNLLKEIVLLCHVLLLFKLVKLFFPSAPQRHFRYRLSLPWKAGSLITVQKAGCDADDCGTRGKLML